jgi:transposase
VEFVMTRSALAAAVGQARLAALGPALFVRFAATRELQVRRPFAERLLAAARDALTTADAAVGRRVLAANLMLARELERKVAAAELELAMLLPDNPFRKPDDLPGLDACYEACRSQESAPRPIDL